MVAKKTGISYDLIFHPGNTIAEILIERSMSQTELAASIGVSTAYISNVLAGKKDISANFAMGLEYALGVPKSFWLNLQANYDAELLELNESSTVTEEELSACTELKEVISYLRKHGFLAPREANDRLVLSLRKVLRVSNLANLKDIVPTGAFRMAEPTSGVNPYVLGAWMRLCQMQENNVSVKSQFNPSCTDALIAEFKRIMLQNRPDFHSELKTVAAQYGIDFSIVKNFRGAPVHGYISQKSDGTYRMVLTIRGAYADIFWFSLFHELGHIVNGDVGKNAKFIDSGDDSAKEAAADCFAKESLLDASDYASFVSQGDFSAVAINRFASSQNVMPYIVIGRLQKEKHLDYQSLSEYKLRYKWDD